MFNPFWYIDSNTTYVFKYLSSGFVTAIMDQFDYHPFFKHKYSREMFAAILCVFSFFLGLPMVTEVQTLTAMTFAWPFEVKFLIFREDCTRSKCSTTTRRAGSCC